MSFSEAVKKSEKQKGIHSVADLDNAIARDNANLTSLRPRLFRGQNDQDAMNLMRVFKDLYVRNYSDDNEHGLPRYCEFSMMARRTAFFLYDCPIFTREVGCDTAFVTNGDHVFMHADFFREMVRLEQETSITQGGVKKRTEHNVDFILTHELGHAAAGHHELFMTMPIESKLSALNPGTDTWLNLSYGRMFNVNASLRGEFNKELGIVTKGAYGLTEEEREFFKDQNTGGIISDVAIVRHYAQIFAELQKQKKQDQSQQNKPGQSGNSAGANGQSQSDNNKNSADDSKDPSNGQPGGDGESKQNSGEKAGPDGDQKGNSEGLSEKIKKAKEAIERAKSNAEDDVHTVSTEKLAEALERSGHGSFKDERLKLPDSNDKSAHKAIQKKAQTDALTDHHQVKQMIKEYEQRTGQKYSGGHIHESMAELIRRRHAVPNSDLNLEDQILNHLIPGGQEMYFSEETPDDHFYLEPSDLGQDYHINRGSDIYVNNQKAILAVLDTSYSMNDSFLSQSSACLKGILEGDNPVNKVYLLHADTVARSGLIEISEDNADEKLDDLTVYGRGGTDLQNGIMSAIAIANEEDTYRQIVGVVVLTDTYDAPPNTEEMREIVDSITGNPDLPPIAYLVPQGIEVESFALSVASHGAVIVYNEKSMDVDLTASPSLVR